VGKGGHRYSPWERKRKTATHITNSSEGNKQKVKGGADHLGQKRWNTKEERRSEGGRNLKRGETGTINKRPIELLQSAKSPIRKATKKR